MRIEDYGFMGDTQPALVGRDGAVDWLCLPRYDSASCFAALVGDERHGRWRPAPAGAGGASSRRYRPGTLVLESDLETAEGAVRMIVFPGSDDRVTGTLDPVSRGLGRDGFVSRCSTAVTDGGLAGGERQFLAWSLWLVSVLALSGRVEEARVLFERLLGLCSDLGLAAEEYVVERGRQVGDFAQAFSQLTPIGAAYASAAAGGDTKPAERAARPMEV